MRIVEKCFEATLVNIENIVATDATSNTDLGVKMSMTNEQYERERRYRVAVSVAINMLKQGLICEDEYQIINERMIKKYNPFFGGIVR